MTNTTVHKTPPKQPAQRQEEERPVRERPQRLGRVSARTTVARSQKGVGMGSPRPFFLEKRAKILNRRTRIAPLGWVLHGRLPRSKPGIQSQWKYRIGIQLGIIAALLVVIAAVRMPIRGGEASLELAPVAQEVVQIEEILQTQQLHKPPPPPPPPVPVEVPNNEIIEDDDLALDATLDIAEPLGSLPPPPPPEDVQEVEVGPEPEIFVAVEQQAEIIGGLDRLYEVLEYPRDALRAGLDGMVIVQFVVAPDGVPYSPEVVRSAGRALDEAAVEAVLKLRFEPARQRGKSVHYGMALPIRFKFVDRASR